MASEAEYSAKHSWLSRRSKAAERALVRGRRWAVDMAELLHKIKLRAILRFLEEGNKVKITLRFRGREMAHQQLGLAQLQKIEADVADFGVVEQAPKMEGRQMGMLIGPKKKK